MPVNSGIHVQIPLWLRGWQSAFSAHWQGSTHFSFRQAKVVEQSASVRHSYCLQFSYGFPLCPGRHVHLDRWFLTLHSALIPHCSNRQGFWHSLLMHAWVNGHSESCLQPATTEIRNVKANVSKIWYKISCIIKYTFAYVLHREYKDLLKIQTGTHKVLDGFWLCIQRFFHMNVWNKDLGIFLVYMQGGLDSLDPINIQVLVLKSNHAYYDVKKKCIMHRHIKFHAKCAGRAKYGKREEHTKMKIICHSYYNLNLEMIQYLKYILIEYLTYAIQFLFQFILPFTLQFWIHVPFCFRHTFYRIICDCFHI